MLSSLTDGYLRTGLKGKTVALLVREEFSHT
jgi:hypothetical protein